MLEIWIAISALSIFSVAGYVSNRAAIAKLEGREPQVISIAGAPDSSPYATCFHCDHTVAKFKVFNGRVACMNCQMKGRE